jgi:hypothetical protein
MLYMSQAILVITQVMMVELTIAVAGMARLVVAGATAGGTDALIMAISACLLLAHNIG